MIETATFQFLDDIAANNNREWFMEHKHRYEEARQNVLDFTAEVLKGLVQIDPLITDQIQAKNCVLRIYRDIRFSKDKTPYKSHFGIGISPSAKNFKGPGYYLHLEPKKSFVTGGSWMPEPEMLKAIRQEIDYNGSDFHAILSRPDFKRYIGELDTDDKLKTSPKGYPADHPDIEYLKLKSLTGSSHLSENDLMGKAAVEAVLVRLKAVYPLMEFLRNAIA